MFVQIAGRMKVARGLIQREVSWRRVFFMGGMSMNDLNGEKIHASPKAEKWLPIRQIKLNVNTEKPQKHSRYVRGPNKN